MYDCLEHSSSAMDEEEGAPNEAAQVRSSSSPKCLVLPSCTKASPMKQPSPWPVDEEHPLETSLLQAALIAAVEVPRRAECLAAICAALEAGADVNARTDYGGTPLHWAAYRNLDAAAVTAAVEALLAVGLDVRAKDDYATALHAAVKNSSDEAAAAAVQTLLAAGADALAKDNNGWTPLHWVLCDNRCRQRRHS